eukprot:gene4816-8402_t
MDQVKDLSQKFKVLSYTGTNKDSPVENVFKDSYEHESIDGNNFVLICEYQSENSNGFEMTNFLIYSYDYEDSPIKSGIVFVTETKPSPEDILKYKDYSNNTIHLNPPNIPFIFFETKVEDARFEIFLKKGKTLKGKYLSFLFIDSHQNNGGSNIEINTISISGKDGYIDLNKIGKKPKEDTIFSKLLFQKDYSDVSFKINDKIIFGHKMLLSMKSEIFKEIIDKIELNQIIELSEVSKKLKLFKLNELCNQSINESLSMDNIFDSYKKLIINGKKESLKQAFIDSFVNFSNELIFDEKFKNLDKEIILEVLKKRNKKYNEFLSIEEKDLSQEEKVQILKTF